MCLIFSQFEKKILLYEINKYLTFLRILHITKKFMLDILNKNFQKKSISHFGLTLHQCVYYNIAIPR